MKTHRFDTLSFLAGLFITAIGLTFLLLPEAGDIVDFLSDAGAWFWPVLFIAVGVAILAPMISRTSSRRDRESSEEDGAS